MQKYFEVPFIILIGLLLTVFLTWPLALKINTYYGEASDYSLVGWILWYNQHSLVTGRIFDQQSFFNSNQYYPFPFSLAYSEHLFVPSLFFTPIYWLTNNLVFSVNSYAILTFVLSFLSSYYCLNYFVKNRKASLIGAFVFTFNPLTFAQFFGDHLQLLAKFFIPPLFLFAYIYLKTPTFKNSFLFFLSFTLNALSGIYFQVFSLIFISIFWTPFLIHKLILKDIKFFSKFLITSLTFLIFLPVLLHFNLPYLQFSSLEGVKRSLEENTLFSARGMDWLSPLKANLAYGKLANTFRSSKDIALLNPTEFTLFLNIVPVFLLIIALFVKKQKVYLGFILVLFFSAAFSFGPYFHEWDLKENLKQTFYYDLYQSFVLFQGIRVLTRYQFIFYLPFSLFVALGVKRLLNLNQKISVLIFVLTGALILVENINKADFNSTSSTLNYISIEKQENSPLLNLLKNKNTVHFPLFNTGAFRNVRYLNWSTQTQENIFNGYSGFGPDDWMKLTEKVKRLDRPALEKLYILGINYLVIHKDIIHEEDWKAYQDNISLLNQGIVYNDGVIEVIDLKKYNFKISLCKTKNVNFEIKSLTIPVTQLTGTAFKLFPKITLTNPKNCYFVNKYFDRYSKVEFTIKEKEQSIPIKLPIIIEPFEKVRIN